MTAPPILVTGVAGFVGSHVAGRLLGAGSPVVGVDNFDPFYPPASKRVNLEQLRAHPGFVFHELDVRDERLRDILRGVPVVVHLAARPGVRRSVECPDLYHALNVEATGRLLELCEAAGVRRVVFASSSSVYGNLEAAPFREDGPLGRPTSPYAATKREGEELVRRYATDAGARAAILRLFSVYGPRMRPDLALHRFAGLLAAGRAIPVLGDGSARRDFTHVADTVGGILAALEWTEGAGAACEVFNVGAGCPVALHLAVSALAECLGAEVRVDLLPEHGADMPATWASTEKATRMLGFTAKVPFAEGIRDFAAWFEREYGRQPSPAA